MAGFWSRLFGGVGSRPTISQEGSGVPKRLNKIVVWFIKNEEGVQRFVFPHGIQFLTLLGYTVSENSASGVQLEIDPRLEFAGITNQTTFAIYKRLETIRYSNGLIKETDMKRILHDCDETLRNTVLSIRTYGTELENLIGILFSIQSEYFREKIPFTCISAYRQRIEQEVLNDTRNQKLCALYLQKNMLEIQFYIMCWLYFTWYGHEFYAPPMAD